MDFRDFLRHHLATLAYRTRLAIDNAPMGFEDFEAGLEVRTPGQILNHINVILGFSKASYIGEKYELLEDLSWLEAIEEFHALLGQFDNAIQLGEPPDDDKLRQIYQGPLADAMTHAGQLMMLRRLAGSPVPTPNFFKADIRAGQLEPRPAGMK
ncbi:hypothetical protein GF377_03460 [candidate division GN15 bacterium]|nr:hypothetical protein [candidate division GN15 bacterium]